MIVGKSEAIKRAVALSEKFAPTGLPILLVGATGTGKELFAQHIHRLSGRKGLLVDVNCGALPRDMVESLLFGHKRGAFTGAVESTVGHIQRADGGTLFLDELASLSPEAQVKLLRVLETFEVQPLGSAAKVRVDVRVVAATDDGLERGINVGPLRRDLYQRLAGVLIELPPLVLRFEDVVPLAEYFAELQDQRLEPDAPTELLKYSWPGNVRELRVTLERAGQLVEDGTISAAAIREAIALGGVSKEGGAESGSLDRVAQRNELLAAGVKHQWRPDLMASELGIRRSALYKRIRAVGVSMRELRESTLSTHVHRTTWTFQERGPHTGL